MQDPTLAGETFTASDESATLLRNADPTPSTLTNNSGTPSTNAGSNYLPHGSYGAGVGMTGATMSTNLYGQFFVGPYNIGQALRYDQLSNIPTETLIGAAANILITGWIINSITGRESVLDSFGLLSSAIAQIGVGAFLTPLSSVKSTAEKTKAV